MRFFGSMAARFLRGVRGDLVLIIKDVIVLVKIVPWILK